MKTIPYGKAYKWIGVVFFTSLFFLGSVYAWQMAISNITQEGQWQVKTLVYHRFGDNRYPSTNTTKETFEQQLKWLQHNGYTSVTASEVIRLTDKDEKKYVCITIDDGYKSFKENGFPLLKKYGMKATLYVNTESVGWGDYLSWEEIKELQTKGIEIGNHSHSHDYFLNKKPEERLLYFESDLELSEKLFKKYLGLNPKTYAYPYGEFSADMMTLLKQKGYNLAFAQNSGVWNESSNSFSIPRFPMSGNVPMEKFASKVLMEPFRLQLNTIEPYILNKDRSLKVELMYNNETYSGIVNYFIDGKLFEDSIVRDSVVRLNLQIPENRRRILLTMTTKNKDNQWCWHSNLIINLNIEE